MDKKKFEENADKYSGVVKGGAQKDGDRAKDVAEDIRSLNNNPRNNDQKMP